MKLVFISDTHGLHHQLRLPEGDMLIHCGDFSRKGRREEVEDFLAWFSKQPHRHKVLIAGNHDFMAERDPYLFQILLPSNVVYLNDEGCEIGGLHIWGSPIQPWFFDWAFNRQRGEDIRKHWELIPEDTDILLTHGPPYGILDMVQRDSRPVGCRDLLKKVKDTPAIRLHAFGHIHEGYGQLEQDGQLFINASILDVEYRMVNRPIVLDISPLSL
jgi:Icc-related predicted phosphoesterase